MKLVKSTAREQGPDDPHVLIVEDDPHLPRVLGRHLDRAGLPWLQVATAAKALEVLELRPVSVVISDLHMPGRDGLSLLEEVGERWPTVRRILWTGHASAQLITEVGTRGRVMSKGLSHALIVDTVARLHRSFRR